MRPLLGTACQEGGGAPGLGGAEPRPGDTATPVTATVPTTLEGTEEEEGGGVVEGEGEGEGWGCHWERLVVLVEGVAWEGTASLLPRADTGEFDNRMYGVVFLT